MAEIREVVSESLQAAIRRLLPSQRGFTEDLQASNVITPIIDLTPTAEGSQLPEYLQTASSFGSITEFISNGSTNTIINTAGFYRVEGVATVRVNGSLTRNAFFKLNDGTTDKILWAVTASAGIDGEILANSFDFITFMRSGDSVKAETTAACTLRGSVRQIADVNGNLIDPSGFTPQ